MGKTIYEMILQLLFLLILFMGLSCNSPGQEHKIEPVKNLTVDSSRKSIKNIRFDFSAKYINSFRASIEISASLFNDNTDTVYFLASSCEGPKYLLQYDTAKFLLAPVVLCNASFPTVFKIAPKEQFDFGAVFKSSNKETKIKLGFDIYAVDKNFDVANKSLGEIFSRTKDKQTIIWAGEKFIK